MATPNIPTYLETAGPYQRLLRSIRRLRSKSVGHSTGIDVDGVGRVHESDTMFDRSPEGVENYLRAGRSAIDNLEAGLQAAGRDFSSVRSCLDMGSGYGRVLRHLCQRIPANKITALDADADSVKFCATEFGVQELVSPPGFGNLKLPATDLIWAGSLLTHLTAEDCGKLLAAFAKVLMPGGLAVLSFHGDWSLQHLAHLYDGNYAEQADELRHEVASTGFAFRPYQGSYLTYDQDQYGMSWHNADWIADKIREVAPVALDKTTFDQVAHFPHSWDNHHDVIVLRRQ